MTEFQPEPIGPELYVDFHLLDRQVVDRDGRLVGKVDDLELAEDDDGVPYLAALLLGPQALGRRVGGLVGRWMAGVSRRQHPDPDPRPVRIPYALVQEVRSAVHLSVNRDDLPELLLESWMRRHVVGTIPGASHAGG